MKNFLSLKLKYFLKQDNTGIQMKSVRYQYIKDSKGKSDISSL